ncbi:MAG: dihydroneopterin aldolase [Ichthyobacteriaceae bacterium]|nr:dihydroneopterin aldolase [Ichthyobacteriaceae bacterium]
MSKILIENIKIYAYHGCLKEENVIGSDYLIDVELELDYSKASATDDLNYTVNYAEVNNVIHEEMAIISCLIEHVAQRIITRIINEFELITEVNLKLSKLNPPMSGDVEKVSVLMSKKR